MDYHDRPLILASASPRRAELLNAAGIPFCVRLSSVPEVYRPGESPVEYVTRLARAKAEAVPRGESEVILAADTTVTVDRAILEKPRDRAEARSMLQALSGRPHDVITGICLRGNRVLVDHATTRVWFSVIGEEEIDSYVDSPEPYDKAGGYGIQGIAARWVQRIDGCYFNVVGLPVSLVWARLRELTREGPDAAPATSR